MSQLKTKLSFTNKEKLVYVKAVLDALEKKVEENKPLLSLQGPKEVLSVHDGKMLHESLYLEETVVDHTLKTQQLVRDQVQEKEALEKFLIKPNFENTGTIHAGSIFLLNNFKTEPMLLFILPGGNGVKLKIKVEKKLLEMRICTPNSHLGKQVIEQKEKYGFTMDSKYLEIESIF